MRHLIDPMDLSVEEINHLLDLADDIILHKEKYQEVCKHKKLATLFFEPSTLPPSAKGHGKVLGIELAGHGEACMLAKEVLAPVDLDRKSVV